MNKTARKADKFADNLQLQLVYLFNVLEIKSVTPRSAQTFTAKRTLMRTVHSGRYCNYSLLLLITYSTNST